MKIPFRKKKNHHWSPLSTYQSPRFIPQTPTRITHRAFSLRFFSASCGDHNQNSARTVHCMAAWHSHAQSMDLTGQRILNMWLQPSETGNNWDQSNAETGSKTCRIHIENLWRSFDLQRWPSSNWTTRQKTGWQSPTVSTAPPFWKPFPPLSCRKFKKSCDHLST